MAISLREVEAVVCDHCFFMDFTFVSDDLG